MIGCQLKLIQVDSTRQRVHSKRQRKGDDHRSNWRWPPGIRSPKPGTRIQRHGGFVSGKFRGLLRDASGRFSVYLCLLRVSLENVWDVFRVVLASARYSIQKNKHKTRSKAKRASGRSSKNQQLEQTEERRWIWETWIDHDPLLKVDNGLTWGEVQLSSNYGSNWNTFDLIC